MKCSSIWSDYKLKNKFSSLNKDINVDVLIVGGGITGINTAYYLKDSNLNVCLVEKNTLGSAITSRTTGKLTYLQENIYSTLTKYFNKNIAKKYFESQKYAIELVKRQVVDNKINCNLEENNSYLFDDNIKKINKEIEILKDFGVNFTNTNILPNNKIVNRGMYVSDTYVFHPLKYLDGLLNVIKNIINIYENTKVISIKKDNDIYVCKINKNTIKAKKIVFACHYPYFLLPFLTPLKCYVEKSYIGAKQTKNNNKFNAINISKPIKSCRYYEDKIVYEIFLTNSHNTCIKENDIDNFKYFINNNYEYIWSNHDMITYDKLPFIGSINEDNTMFIGTGYNTWGMTNGCLAGKIISDIILEKNNDFINLFNPKRCINLGKVLNVPLILGSNFLSFSKSKIIKNKNWYNNNVRFEKRNGKDVAIYIDEEKKEHIVYNLCPHLKCSLIFNEVERTWDCPCHGSRFTIDGKCIIGPSNYNISYKE